MRIARGFAAGKGQALEFHVRKRVRILAKKTPLKQSFDGTPSGALL